MTFAGVLSPTSATFSVPTGQPATTGATLRLHRPRGGDPRRQHRRRHGDDPGHRRRLRVEDHVLGRRHDLQRGPGLDDRRHQPLLRGRPDGHAEVAGRHGGREIFARNGGTGENLCQVVFDDAAARSISIALAGDDPFTGSWRPIQPLAPLLDASTNGDLDVQGHRLRRRRHRLHPRGVAIADRLRGGLTSAASTSASVL